MSQTPSLLCRLEKFLSAIHDTMLVAIVIPISCLKLLYFRGTGGLLIFFTHSSHLTVWFYRCSYSRTGIPILLVYFFHYVMETRINICLFPIGLMKIPAALMVPSLNIALYQSLTKFIFISVMEINNNKWISTKVEKHRLFILTKSRTAAPNQVKSQDLGKTACQPWCYWNPVWEVQLGQTSTRWLNGDWTLTETVCCSCDACNRKKP